MPCITLLSDFGLQDAPAAMARGVLLQYTSLPVIDISHDVKPYYMPQAAYLLGTAYSSFERGTVHLALFDMFAGGSPRLVLCAHEDQYFIAPDNGLITMALGTDPDAWMVLEPEQQHTFKDWLHAAGRTIAALQTGTPAALGLAPTALKKAKTLPAPVIDGNTIACDVLHIDYYDNVVLNLTRELFMHTAAGRPFVLRFMMGEEIGELSQNYHDVREGLKLCRFNSHGYLEICINRGKAASLFGLRLGSRHNDIKIVFE
jgi:S-adenosylmethionine hydrolase